MTHRVLTITSLLVALLSFAPARAAESLPNVQLGPESKRRLDTYRAASQHTLKDILSPMVATAAKGEEFLGARWTAESGRILTLLKSLEKAGVIKNTNPLLRKWYDDEIAAWQNVQKIGYEMLDLHYRMASNVEEIEKDTKDSAAFYTRFKDITGRTNDHMGNLGEAMSAASESIQNLQKFNDNADKITTILGLLSDNSQTVAWLIRKFHERQFAFIKERGKLDVHRDALSRLKAKNIDPDQNNVFAGFEKDWEEKMAKTLERYVKAVEEWKKVNRWHEGREQLYSMFKTAVGNMGGIPLKFLTVGMPPFLPESAADIDSHIIVLRGRINEAIKKFKGEKWAEIEKGLRDADQERRDLRVGFEKKLDENDKEARRRAARAEEDYEKVARPLQSEYNQLAAKLARETDDRTKNILSRQMGALKDKIDSVKRVLDNMRHLHLEVWLGEQEDVAYKELRAAIKAIDDRVAKLNQAKRDLD